tara:strand:- start:523 stop:1095 length:573 start_codon:yes stop_codon:yes gene_type:complete
MKYLEVVTPNTTQIVSTADLKTHLRITFSDDDSYIDSLEAAAVGMVEEFTNRFLLETAVTQYGNTFGDLEILFKSPAHSGSERVYYMNDGAWVLLLISLTEFVYAIEPARLYSRATASIPTADDVFEAWKVNYTVGYASAADIPSALIQAIKIIVSDFYENRQSVIVGKIASEIPRTAQYLMNPYKVQTL